jgi:hypothetical protein
MTTVPVDLHRELAKSTKAPPIPEPWTWREMLQFTVVGLVLFSMLFAFMFALGSMQ